MLPEIALQIIKTADDPDASVDDMAAVIVRAPELSTRLLKVVNSAFYGLPQRVTSVDRAVAMMGFSSVKNVAIATSLTRVFQGQPLSATFSPKDLWTHSIAVATASRMVAVATRWHAPDEAFLAGLIHDIGLMVELQFDRSGLATVLARLEADATLDLLAAERQVFGATHEDFGAGLSEHWRLPLTLSRVVGWHHRPLELPASERTLVTLVHVADRLVVDMKPPFLLDARSSEISDAALDHLRMGREQLAEIAAVLPAAVEEAQAFLSE